MAKVTIGKAVKPTYREDGNEWMVEADGSPVGSIRAVLTERTTYQKDWYVVEYHVDLLDDNDVEYVRDFPTEGRTARKALAAAKAWAREVLN